MITLKTVTEKLTVGAVDPRYSTLKMDSKKFYILKSHLKSTVNIPKGIIIGACVVRARARAGGAGRARVTAGRAARSTPAVILTPRMQSLCCSTKLL